MKGESEIEVSPKNGIGSSQNPRRGQTFPKGFFVNIQDIKVDYFEERIMVLSS